jgi:putative Mg2+ transporter-C (MgtC) family protein
MQGYEFELIGQLIIAFVFGVLIGFDRERSGKAAGIRTQMLICVGSALLAGISVHIANKYGTVGDPSRLMAQIVTGIGFVGAGVIIKSQHRVSGVTTAATIWTTAAIGIAIGSGFYVPAVVTTIFVLLLDPLAALQYKYGLKSYAYVLKVPKDDWEEVRKILKHLQMKYRITNISHEGRQMLISSSEEKKRIFLEKMSDKGITFDISEVED